MWFFKTLPKIWSMIFRMPIMIMRELFTFLGVYLKIFSKHGYNFDNEQKSKNCFEKRLNDYLSI